VVHGVGGLKQEEWRQYRTLLTKEPARGFVDGDLVEAFLDLPPSTAAQVVAALGKDVTLEAVTHKVEELSRLH
jgi:DNA damage-binding protein 1